MMLIYRYPELALKSPSLNLPKALRISVAAAKTGLTCTYSIIMIIIKRLLRGEKKKKGVRRIPRFKKRKVYGSLGSMSRLKRLMGNTGAFGGRPWSRMSRERSPPR